MTSQHKIHTLNSSCSNTRKQSQNLPQIFSIKLDIMIINSKQYFSFFFSLQNKIKNNLAHTCNYYQLHEPIQLRRFQFNPFYVYPIIIRPLIPCFSGCLHRLILLLLLYNIIDQYGKRLAYFFFFFSRYFAVVRWKIFFLNFLLQTF